MMDYHRYRPIPVYDAVGTGKLVPAAPRLVALCGTAGSGKSTAAAALTEAPDAQWVRVKFADALKDMLRALYMAAGLDHDEIEARIEGHLKETPCSILRGQTPRHAMITLGTEWGRDLIAHDLWISIWRRRVNKWMDLGMNVVVDDLRFANEAAAVRDLGGTVVRISGRNTSSIAHISEKGVFDEDYVVMNTGSIEDLTEDLCASVYAN